jgi:hypothetical protein
MQVQIKILFVINNKRSYLKQTTFSNQIIEILIFCFFSRRHKPKVKIAKFT